MLLATRVSDPDFRSTGLSGQTRPVELLIARNPDPDSTLPYLLRLPIARIRPCAPGTTALMGRRKSSATGH